jgi:RNA-directed DNA polymerase
VNPIIRGWARYHRHAVSAHVFQSVDHAIVQTLWRWARRRHPPKGVPWVNAHYCHPVGERNWVFAGKARGPTGKFRAVHLLTAHRLPLKRHTKSTGKANPYDPTWEL